MALRAIVFGPTGNVGSIVARTAQEHGAKVFLAMRDIRKTIPGLNSSQEARGGFERIQADLTQPSSIVSAVKQAQSTCAFMYMARTPDHMKASIQALKDGGITFVVFLSSFTIKGDLEKIPPTDRIPFIHARIEMNLKEIFGRSQYVALRAGAFATNTLRWRTGIASGEVQLENPDTEYDFITPIDMGEVGGKILATGQQNGQHTCYLYGPHLMKQKDAILAVLKALEKDAQVVSQESHQNGTSEHSGNRIIVKLGAEEAKSAWFQSAYTNHNEGVDNISKYLDRPATNYADWVNSNKSGFKL